MKKLKRVVIKEELVALTGDYRRAIILNQFLYWTDIKHEADKMLEEEIKIARKNEEEVKFEPQYGWIYKTSEQLSEEIMLGLSKSNIRKYIKELVEMGYILERKNPKYKWDRTLQYRVNLQKVADDLRELGYPLEGYSLTAARSSKIEHRDYTKGENRSSKIEQGSHEIEHQGHESEHHSDDIKTTIPKITSETTTEITNKEDIYIDSTESIKARPKKSNTKELEEKFEELWKLYPRKEGKADAKRHFLKAIKDGVDIELIRTKILEYKELTQLRGDSIKYIKLGSTWFNKHWEDEYAAEINELKERKGYGGFKGHTESSAGEIDEWWNKLT